VVVRNVTVTRSENRTLAVRIPDAMAVRVAVAQRRGRCRASRRTSCRAYNGDDLRRCLISIVGLERGAEHPAHPGRQGFDTTIAE
jgi:hypothetical protein